MLRRFRCVQIFLKKKKKKRKSSWVHVWGWSLRLYIKYRFLRFPSITSWIEQRLTSFSSHEHQSLDRASRVSIGKEVLTCFVYGLFAFSYFSLLPPYKFYFSPSHDRRLTLAFLVVIGIPPLVSTLFQLVFTMIYIHFFYYLVFTSGGEPRERGDQPEDDEGDRERYSSKRASGRGDDRGRDYLRAFGGAFQRRHGATGELPGLPRCFQRCVWARLLGLGLRGGEVWRESRGFRPASRNTAVGTNNHFKIQGLLVHPPLSTKANLVYFLAVPVE